MKNCAENIRVLFVGASRSTHGGVTSVLKAYEKMPFWRRYGCSWLETQTNNGFLYKLYYAFSSCIKAPFIVPKYDIVHFHTIPGISMLVQLPAFLCALVCRKKTVIHLHCGDQLADYRNSWFSKWVMNSSTVVVALARRWKNYLEENYSLRTRVTYIYNPVSRIESSRKDRKKIILFAAYFTPNKGYETILNAFSSLSEDFPDWKLIMAGTGPGKDMDSIREFVRRNNLSERVELPGWIGGQEKEELFRTASVYCLASKAEGFPMSVTESWAYGTPVISTPAGGITDVAEDGKNILLFNYGDDNALEEKLRTFMSDPELQKQLSEESLRMSSLFRPEVIDGQLCELYESILHTDKMS